MRGYGDHVGARLRRVRPVSAASPTNRMPSVGTRKQVGIAQTLSGAVFAWATSCMTRPMPSPKKDTVSATSVASVQRPRFTVRTHSTPTTPSAMSAQPISHWNIDGV